MRILLVDDDPALRTLLRTTFEVADVEVVDAASADEARRAIDAAHPSVIVLDVNMPGKTGLELCRELKDDPEALALQERDAREHRLPEHRVRLHAPALRRAERTGLLEDPVRDPDLADVVQEEAVLRARVVADGAFVDAPGERDRIVLDALRVRARARVLRLERARERRDGLAVGVLEQHALAPLELEEVP